ncbi:hypothetical protein ACFW6F_35740 [Streptomyces sp. NPDC058746]|uniref:hypothetical protein n=1 Tax=Streptomyces sp. NPDC058746 TaxID=3346622 RepID=UPI00369B4FB7
MPGSAPGVPADVVDLLIVHDAGAVRAAMGLRGDLARAARHAGLGEQLVHDGRRRDAHDGGDRRAAAGPW